MSVCVISQPRFFPGLHYLHRMMVSDIFVIFDSVDFNPRHEENRSKLKSPQGQQWLTVPIQKGSRGQPIRDTRIDNRQAWQRKAVKTIRAFYAKTPYYEVYAQKINSIIESKEEKLTVLDRNSWDLALQLLEIDCRFVYASEIPVSGKGPRLLLDICKYLGANTYLSGAFGQEYLNISEFAAEKVDVKLHDYTYPVYPQRFGEFVPFLSYLDMLMNIGLDRYNIMAGGKILDAKKSRR